MQISSKIDVVKTPGICAEHIVRNDIKVLGNIIIQMSENIVIQTLANTVIQTLLNGVI